MHSLRAFTQPADSTPKTQPPRKTMPTYHVEMLEGRTLEQKKKLVEAITRVSVEVLGGQPDSVDVLITDIKRENWATGGKLWSEPRS
jgi:4-oxalocrotonate tautomerase